MLLLVLIFVLAAFGLLLVALVTGTAAWAWISVAVSVAAAGALVYDWAQRRAAIRSGGGGDRTLGGAASLSGRGHEPPTAAIPVMGGAMMDPRTEVFPPVRSSPPPRPPVADAPETVAFKPVSPPPGSPGRPSGAQPDGATGGEQWSPRVTAGGRDRSDAPKSPAGAPSGDHDGGSAERTSRLASAGAAKGRDAEGGSSDSDSAGSKGRRTPPARDQSEQWKPKQPAKAEGRPSDAGTPGDSYEDSDGQAKAPAAGKAADRSGPDADSARTTAIPMGDAKAPAERSQRDEQQKAGQRKAEQREPERDDGKGTEPPAQEPEAAAEEPEDKAAEKAPEQAGPPEPEEEQADSEAEAIVAELDDEVLVIDEHPRYHLDGCRVLEGNETIPLPAKEAVEYGFTPCGTCTPVSTLAERNRAASSS